MELGGRVTGKQPCGRVDEPSGVPASNWHFEPVCKQGESCTAPSRGARDGSEPGHANHPGDSVHRNGAANGLDKRVPLGRGYNVAVNIRKRRKRYEQRIGLAGPPRRARLHRNPDRSTHCFGRGRRILRPRGFTNDGCRRERNRGSDQQAESERFELVGFHV